MSKYGYYSLIVNEEVTGLAEQLEQLGCELVVTDMLQTKASERTELYRLIAHMSAGDVIVVPDLCRLARCTTELLEIMYAVINKEARIISTAESWVEAVFGDTVTTTAMLGGLHDFEKSLLSLRVKEGMEIAKSKGVTIGRPTANSNKLDHAINLYMTNQYTSKEITEICGISKSTLYRELRKRNLVRK